ncbi:Transmembrane protein 14C [Halotydeus destructor]|nr:Transmembrane protein 14C [Halotydeus destructor]
MSPRADKLQPQSPDIQQPIQRNAVPPNIIESAEVVVNHFGVQGDQEPQIVVDHSGLSEDSDKEAELTDRVFVREPNSVFGYEMPFDVISAAYAATVAAGGIIGYLKAASIPSLAAGLTFGSVLGVGAYMTSVNPDNYYLTLGTSTALGGMMGYKFFKSGKFMPAGLVALLSVGMIVRFSLRALSQKQQYKK